MYKTYYIKAKNLKTNREERLIVRAASRAFAIQLVDNDNMFGEIKFYKNRTFK